MCEMLCFITLGVLERERENGPSFLRPLPSTGNNESETRRSEFSNSEETNALVRKFKKSHNDFFKSHSEEMQKRIKDEEARLRNLPSILEVRTNETSNSPGAQTSNSVGSPPQV
jgi:hypothetical protein